MELGIDGPQNALFVFPFSGILRSLVTEFVDGFPPLAVLLLPVSSHFIG